MKLSHLTSYLESLAPLAYQEDYDNSGLIVGNPDAEVLQALLSLDCTEAIVDEAIAKGCQVIISHHPIVFRGLKKFTGKTYVERVVAKAIKNDIAIYAIHTNLDNVAEGVNAKICEILELTNLRILAPKNGLLKKLVTYVIKPNRYVTHCSTLVPVILAITANAALTAMVPVLLKVLKIPTPMLASRARGITKAKCVLKRFTQPLSKANC